MTKSERVIKSKNKNKELYREIDRQYKARKRGTDVTDIEERKRLRKENLDCYEIFVLTGFLDKRINNKKDNFHGNLSRSN